MTEIVITSAKRTPIGKFMGTLANLSAPDLGKIALDNTLLAIVNWKGMLLTKLF